MLWYVQPVKDGLRFLFFFLSDISFEFRLRYVCVFVCNKCGISHDASHERDRTVKSPTLERSLFNQPLFTLILSLRQNIGYLWRLSCHWLNACISYARACVCTRERLCIFDDKFPKTKILCAPFFIRFRCRRCGRCCCCVDFGIYQQLMKSRGKLPRTRLILIDEYSFIGAFHGVNVPLLL